MNQLLAEMDGFDSSKGLVILQQQTVRKYLIRHFFRPGRFDRRVIVETPDLKGRVETLKVHAKMSRWMRQLILRKSRWQHPEL